MTISYRCHMNDLKIFGKIIRNKLKLRCFLINYLIPLGISFNVFLNLIMITARVYKLQLAEIYFLSCYSLYILRLSICGSSSGTHWLYILLWKRVVGSHPHNGQSPFAFIKAVQNFQYWNALHRKFLWKRAREIQGVSFFQGLTPWIFLAFLHRNFLWNCI